jgi:hypothetical protein
LLFRKSFGLALCSSSQIFKRLSAPRFKNLEKLREQG